MSKRRTEAVWYNDKKMSKVALVWPCDGFFCYYKGRESRGGVTSIIFIFSLIFSRMYCVAVSLVSDVTRLHPGSATIYNR